MFEGPSQTERSSSGEAQFLSVTEGNTGAVLELRNGNEPLAVLGVDRMSRQGYLTVRRERVNEPLEWLPERSGSAVVIGGEARESRFGLRLLTAQGRADLVHDGDDVPHLAIRGRRRALLRYARRVTPDQPSPLGRAS